MSIMDSPDLKPGEEYAVFAYRIVDRKSAVHLRLAEARSGDVDVPTVLFERGEGLPPLITRARLSGGRVYVGLEGRDPVVLGTLDIAYVQVI